MGKFSTALAEIVHSKNYERTEEDEVAEVARLKMIQERNKQAAQILQRKSMLQKSMLQKWK